MTNVELRNSFYFIFKRAERADFAIVADPPFVAVVTTAESAGYDG